MDFVCVKNNYRKKPHIPKNRKKKNSRYVVVVCEQWQQKDEIREIQTHNVNL